MVYRKSKGYKMKKLLLILLFSSSVYANVDILKSIENKISKSESNKYESVQDKLCQSAYQMYLTQLDIVYSSCEEHSENSVKGEYLVNILYSAMEICNGLITDEAAEIQIIAKDYFSKSIYKMYYNTP